MSWFQYKELNAAKDKTFRIIQITDCHLFRHGSGDTYHGVDSEAYLTRVLKHLSEQFAHGKTLDCVVVTGDITQDHSRESYLVLRDLCQQYLADTTIAWLPGNHDELDMLSGCFAEPPFITAKQLQLGHWQLVLLNTKGPTPAGWLAPDHLAEIELTMGQLDDSTHVAVFCHHHLLPVGGYIDKHIASNGEQLLGLLRGFNAVKCISHGHVHQEKETVFKRCSSGLASSGLSDLCLWATPSTSMQFLVNNMTGGNDDRGPGYRYFELHPSGQVDSKVTFLIES